MNFIPIRRGGCRYIVGGCCVGREGISALGLLLRGMLRGRNRRDDLATIDFIRSESIFDRLNFLRSGM